VQSKLIKGALYFVLLLVAITNCTKDTKKKGVSSEPLSFKESRWYTQQQFELGKQVFTANCAQCHGGKGQGLVEDWKTPNPNGQFPAPPLNGTAHTWHHSTEVLMETINKGGIPLGGSMPAFKEVLSEEEKLAVIAFVQNLWDDETYNKWLKINNSN
jgi:mono/diheme cytochrome c family protein